MGLIFRRLCGYRHGDVAGSAADAVAAFLMVGTITGILMATFMNNGGGAWDNAKKYIETGAYGGKGSDAHKARWSAIRSAIRSRTPLDRPCTC